MYEEQEEETKAKPVIIDQSSCEVDIPQTQSTVHILRLPLTPQLISHLLFNKKFIIDQFAVRSNEISSASTRPIIINWEYFNQIIYKKNHNNYLSYSFY